jgi:DNA-binding MarR family transcriptional regulator
MTSSHELLDQCACTRLRTAARLVTRAYDDALRPAEIKASQLSVLAAIDAVELASIAALSKVLAMDRTTLSRNLQPLVTQGLVTLAEGAGGRAKSARITKAGQAKLKEAVPLWRKAQAALTGQAGASKVDDLNLRLAHLIRTY